MKIIESFEENKTLAMSNKFAIAVSKKTLSRPAQKIEAWLISQIKKEDKQFNKYKLTAKTSSNILNLDENNTYKMLIEIAEELISHTIKIKDGNKYKILSLISSAVYHKGEGSFEISFDPELKPYLLELQKSGGFTVLELETAQRFERRFTYPIYKILKSFLYTNINDYNFIIKIDELKDILGCVDKYPNFSNFAVNVLEPSRAEIKEKSDIYFTYKTHEKKRRKILSLQLHIYRKNTPFTADTTIAELDPLEEKLNSLGFNGDFQQLCKEVPYEAVKYYTAVILEDKMKRLKVKNKSEFIYLMITSNAEMIYNIQPKSVFVEQEHTKELELIKNELIALKITTSIIDDVLKSNEISLLKKVLKDTHKAVTKGGVDNEAAFFISKLKAHKKAEELKHKKTEEQKRQKEEEKNALSNKLIQFKAELLTIYSTRIESGIVKNADEAFLQDWNNFKQIEEHKLTCLPNGTTTIDYLNKLKCKKIDDLSNEDLYMFLKWKGFYV